MGACKCDDLDTGVGGDDGNVVDCDTVVDVCVDTYVGYGDDVSGDIDTVCYYDYDVDVGIGHGVNVDVGADADEYTYTRCCANLCVCWYL